MAISPLGTFKNKIIFAAAWLAWSLMQVKLLQDWGLPGRIATMDSLVSNLLLAAMTVLIINNLKYYRPKKGKYIYLIIVCGVKAWLLTAIVKYAMINIYPDQKEYLQFLDRFMPIRFYIALLITLIVALISELFYTLEEQKESEHRKTDAEKLAREAELYKLRQQLQPHFLFNSLNSISALITIQPAQARKMIQQLSDFLRGTLKKEDNQWISLEDELQHLQLYLDIEKVRFGHRLNTTLHSETCDKLQLPSMLLQPLVENAIKFGLYDTTDTVTISIAATQENNYLVITIQNPFDPETSSPKHGTGFGLSSVQRRLYLLFARNDLLNTRHTDNLFTTVIKIPQPS
ncbi:histidine kinase [Niastella yeongjuensis]|uniref:Histidine kinase n=1 Tax=Niastella yeongjuensis TaxID=354355 RepID=A0A1V9EY83_9BACT|nr:histidine kinase [Niastella yeongjuensis]OQP51039.1 histidine kinase [Niastella yeongjuensis]SEN05489.1 GHKL domain-containing protein [Niastella yeongjuensis]